MTLFLVLNNCVQTFAKPLSKVLIAFKKWYFYTNVACLLFDSDNQNIAIVSLKN